MINCTFEDGGEGNLRHVAVAAILINDKDEVLLGKRAKHLREGGKYNLMAGFMNRDESIEGALMREVKEESGCNMKIDYLFYINDNTDVPGSDWQNVIFIFVGHIKDKVSIPDKESSELKWFSVDNLPDKKMFCTDHYERLQIYKRYLKEKFPIPFIRSSFTL